MSEAPPEQPPEPGGPPEGSPPVAGPPPGPDPEPPRREGPPTGGGAPLGWPPAGPPPGGRPPGLGFDPGPPPGPGWWLAADGRWYSPDQRPGYSYGGPWGAGQHAVPRSDRWNGYAVASFVLGLTWLFWLGSLLALVFGPIALSQLPRTGQRGRGLAVAGIVLGALGIVFLLLGLIGLATDDDTLR